MNEFYYYVFLRLYNSYLIMMEIYFFKSKLWNEWHDFLDIDTSKYPPDIRKFKEKCDKTGITEYAMKNKGPFKEFFRLCKVNDLPYFKINDIYKDYQFSNLFVIKEKKGRRKID